MNTSSLYKLIFLSFLMINFSSCNIKQNESEKNKISKTENEKSFKLLILKHLNSVKNRDLNALKATLSPKGNMELIQPSSEIIYSVDGFMKFHQEWFEATDWTINTKILSTNIGNKVGVATTEFLYQESERNGKPYFNRLIVTYALEKIDDNWYIIKDHASSIEKSTDKK